MKDSDGNELCDPVEAAAAANNVRGSEYIGKAESLHWPTFAVFIKTYKHSLQAGD